jgi:hypothetical protein
VFVAHGASEVLVVVENEGELAIWGRTPRHVLLLLKSILQLELDELCELRRLQEVLDVNLVDPRVAVRSWTGDGELVFVDPRVDELSQALRMEDVLAHLQGDHLVLAKKL